MTEESAVAGAKGRQATGQIQIDAPVERVWRALTEAAELERWFPLGAEVEPGPGGRIWMSWGNEFGSWSEILAWEPPHHLAVSWAWGANEAQVTDYRVEGRAGGTHLRVVTSGFPDGAGWDDLVEGTRLGWLFELRQLRHYLENHDGQPRHARYIRRRVSLSRGEAWARLMEDAGAELRAISADVFDESPPWQLAAITREPADGMIRATVDPTHDDPGRRDVTLWLSSWGAADDLEPAAAAWRRRLARIFPDGETLEPTA